LPFPEGGFDLVWCAQSLVSLEEPLVAVREMSRVVKPGGYVAVLEDDEFHHVLLPWPAGLEAALQAALLRGSRRRYGRAIRLQAVRRLRHILSSAGLRPLRKKTYSADRLAPFSGPVRDFLRLHLASLRERAAGHLGAAALRHFDRLADPDHPASLLRRGDAELTCLCTLVLGQR
jgi:SAM-dependent methyltransferase